MEEKKRNRSRVKGGILHRVKCERSCAKYGNGESGWSYRGPGNLLLAYATAKQEEGSTKRRAIKGENSNG